MKNFLKKALALTLALSMASAMSLSAMAMGGMDPGGSGGSESGNAGVTGDSAPSTAAIYVSGSTVTESNIDGMTYTLGDLTTSGTTTTITGLNLKGTDYTNTGVVATDGATVKVIDSTLYMTVDSEDTVDTDSTSMAIAVDGSSTLYITDSEVTVDGAGRYTIGAYSSATMIVTGSKIVATGKSVVSTTDSVSDAASNAALLISGTSRSNFSIGATHTFYYSSECIAEGWAALSTDSATGNGLELIAYNTYAEATNGGYGTYADTSCRVYLYAATINAAEVGAIISNNGAITIGSGSDATSATTSDGYTILQYNEAETTDAASVIYAGRNCFQIHSPDMMGSGTDSYQGVLTISNSTLTTEATSANGYTLNAVSSQNYYTYYDLAIGSYVDYVKGSVILIKSTGASITLDNVEMSSSNNTLIHSVINSDSMSRFLKSGTAKSVDVSMSNMSVAGDIVHDDYQRPMYVTLSNATLEGAITYTTAQEWYDYWSDLGITSSNYSSAYWTTLNSSTYLTTTQATTLTLTNNSTWVVTDDSALTTLTITSGSVVPAEGYLLVLDGDESTTYTELTSGTYSSIALSLVADPDYVAPDGEEEGEEEGVDKSDAASVIKAAGAETAANGAVVAYTLTSSVPEKVSSNYVLTFVDDLAEGALEIVEGSVAVTIGGEAVEATISTEDGLKVEVALGGTEYATGTAIVVSYTAVISGDEEDQVVNKAYVSWGNTDDDKSVESSATVTIVGDGVHTGGQGTALYTTVGVCLLLVACVMFFIVKRKESK